MDDLKEMTRGLYLVERLVFPKVDWKVGLSDGLRAVQKARRWEVYLAHHWACCSESQLVHHLASKLVGLKAPLTVDS